MRTPWPWLIGALALLLVLSAAVTAQQETATMTGEVTDPSGAVVPRATVSAINIATSISVRTEANEQGFYRIPSLRPGEYLVMAESPGFNRTARSGVTLQVAQTARVDLTLQAGEVTEVVEVRAAASLLESQTSSRGLVID